ncbi:DUF2797 domain-containing protein, partial [Streptomyces sp. DT225]
KREVRAARPGPAERAAEVAALYGRAAALEGAGWPEALERMPFAAVDHAEVFGLWALPGAVAGGGAGPVRAVTGLVD